MRAMSAILRIEEVSSGVRDESRNSSFYAKTGRVSVVLSEPSPGSADASRSIPMAQPIFVVAIGVLRLVGRRGDLLAQDDNITIGVLVGT
jgi:hypothetical protein